MLAVGVAGLVLIADRATKSFAASWRSPGKAGLEHNRALLLLWLAALAGIAIAGASGRVFQPAAAQMGLGAALAGAASNFYDRIRWGGVIDFIDVHWWPSFNLADVAITLGAGCALWFM
jgi:signal peptidase II